MAMDVEGGIRDLKHRVGEYGKLDSLDRKIDVTVDCLAKALPGIVIDAVREANRDHGRKR